MAFTEPFTLIVNPKAGAGAAARKLEALRGALASVNAQVEIVSTTRRAEATELTREALKRGVRGIGVVGGDGTLNEVANGFFEPNGDAIRTEAWFAPFSAGTGGDFCRSLRMPTEVNAMVNHIADAQARPIDVGWADYTRADGSREGRAFLNIASFGLSAVVDRVIESLPKMIGGRATYFLGALIGMTRYAPARVSLGVNGEVERDTEVLTMAIANAQYFGGGMHIAPSADIADGMLDVVGLENISRIRSVGLSSAIYGGRILTVPGVTHRHAAKLFARAADPGHTVLVEMDGEAPGQLPATFIVKPKALLLRA